jgi:CspA family cold shock protein
MSGNTVSKPANSSRYIGRVKWFNSRSGFGFITVTDGPKSGTDIFAHHSSILVDSEQYRYLVQGEYIEFGIGESTSDDHEFQAEGISGIKGGKLMCETRRESRMARSHHREEQEVEEKEWTKVVKGKREENRREENRREEKQPKQDKKQDKKTKPKQEVKQTEKTQPEKKTTKRTMKKSE